MKIGIDVDDVVIEYMPNLVDFYNRVHDDDVVIGEVTNWGLQKHFKHVPSEEKLSDFIVEFSETDVYGRLPPIDGAIEGVKELENRGHDLYFITSRHGTDKTYKWFDSHGLSIENIFFSKEKDWIVDKLNIDLMVDDRVYNLDGCGCDTLLFSNPWNESYKGEHVRIRDWNDLIGEVDKRE